MKILFKKTATHPHETVSRLCGVMRSAKMSAAILLCAQFCNPDQAHGQMIPGSYKVNLAWDSCTSAGVIGYRVRYGTASGVYTQSITFGNVTDVSIPGLASGVTYFFTVTAINDQALESELSNQVLFLPGLDGTRIRTAPGGEMVLTITGLIGRQYDIEATQDLKTWTIIGSVTPGEGGSLEFSDPNAPNFPKRFYRTRKSP